MEFLQEVLGSLFGGSYFLGFTMVIAFNYLQKKLAFFSKSIYYVLGFYTDTDYRRLVRKLPSLQARKITPTLKWPHKPKFSYFFLFTPSLGPRSPWNFITCN